MEFQNVPNMSNQHKPTMFGKKVGFQRLPQVMCPNESSWPQVALCATHGLVFGPLWGHCKWKLELIRRRWRCSCTSGVWSTGFTCYISYIYIYLHIFCHWSCPFIGDSPLPMLSNVWFPEGRIWVKGGIALHRHALMIKSTLDDKCALLSLLVWTGFVSW